MTKYGYLCSLFPFSSQRPITLPRLQLCHNSSPQDHTQDQFRSFFHAKSATRSTGRTISFANSPFCHTSGPHAGPFLQQISCKTAAQNHTQDQFRSKLLFLPHFRTTVRTTGRTNSPSIFRAKQKRATVSAAPILHCVRCV